MRHLKSGRKLGRTSAHRKALFRNMVTALIRQERIRTTLAKAKELRSHVEKTITLGKKGTLHARRQALRVIQDKEAFLKLFGPLSERFAERKGGYTRIIRVGNRRGDDAPMALIELVDREEETPAPPVKDKKESKGKAKKEAAPKKTEGKKDQAEEKKKAEPKKKEDAKSKKSEAKPKAATKKASKSSEKSKKDDK